MLPTLPLRIVTLCLLAVLLAGCGGTAGRSATAASFQAPAVTLTPVATGLSSPLDLQPANDGTARLFAVEQAGAIRIIQNGALLPQPFLDIRSKVLFGGEQGFLGLAFHPHYPQNGRFFVHYDRTLNGQTQSVFSEFHVSAADPNQADPNSERILLTVNQPFANHKGGQLTFGPDGFLYIGLGDGGSEGDPLGNGQSLQTLLGKILRIDVDSAAAATPYAIPADNPFVSGGGLPEIWAYGLRNPWRFSFDRPTGRLFCGEVGQDRFEEIDLIQPAGNFGWNIMEGFHCFNPMSGCNMSGLILPITEYDHTEGKAVIGGYVYHGTAIPGLQQTYLFGDFDSGTIWGLHEDSSGGWARASLVSSGRHISSFGQDAAGEVYVVDYSGSVFRLSPQ